MNNPFPTELLLSIFINLDGKSLVECSTVSRHWYYIINHFDELIWPNACLGDFQNPTKSRFWSLYFPEPVLINTPIKKEQNNWQRMYRITRNWYQGNCVGYYPHISTELPKGKKAYSVIGNLQEQGMFTLLTTTYDGSVVRSNPNYQSASQQSLMIQSPFTKDKQHIQWSNIQLPGWPDAASSHIIVCHYSLPSSKWLATGALNGTVALWDLEKKSLVRMCHAHRGRVLSITMNDKVIVSGGSDNVVQVWDIEESCTKPVQRGMIDISKYLYILERQDWFQGVGELAIHHDLVACASESSGTVLIFSILTGTLIYLLQMPKKSTAGNFASEDMTTSTGLCMTPFFLLTRGRISNKCDKKIVPSTNNVLLQRKNITKPKAPGYVMKNTPTLAQMTPYQLSRYYQTVNSQEMTEEYTSVSESSACIHVWNLKTGKLVYRLLPVLPNPNQNYTITNIQLSPDYSKVFASIQSRGQTSWEEHLYCWDFSSRGWERDDTEQDFEMLELDTKDTIQQKVGKSWVCFM